MPEDPETGPRYDLGFKPLRWPLGAVLLLAASLAWNAARLCRVLLGP